MVLPSKWSSSEITRNNQLKITFLPYIQQEDEAGTDRKYGYDEVAILTAGRSSTNILSLWFVPCSIFARDQRARPLNRVVGQAAGSFRRKLKSQHLSRWVICCTCETVLRTEFDEWMPPRWTPTYWTPTLHKRRYQRCCRLRLYLPSMSQRLSTQAMYDVYASYVFYLSWCLFRLPAETSVYPMYRSYGAGSRCKAPTYYCCRPETENIFTEYRITIVLLYVNRDQRKSKDT